MLPPEMSSKLKYLLIKHESLKKYPYFDTTGNLTIGIGRNLTKRGISESESLTLLDDDIAYFESKLALNLLCYEALDDVRKIVLIDMCFNLGFNGLLEFKNMFLALEAHDYNRAANEMLQSKWAKQVGLRAIELSNMMATGKFD